MTVVPLTAPKRPLTLLHDAQKQQQMYIKGVARNPVIPA